VLLAANSAKSMSNTSVSHDYAASIAYLYGRINYEQVPAVRQRLNLSNMRLLLEHLGSPHLRIPVVHVAGTKGKGSTSSMVASILTQAGYRTALYTSPHLACLEERFSVDGICCQRDELAEFTEQIRPAVQAVDREIQSVHPDAALTFFEITTAIAWLHFIRQQAEIAVLEVGMGGRLDSTNLCKPLVTVITSISFDHTKQLGNTLAAIAREKAGIIKHGVPIISGVQQSEAAAVIGEIAHREQAPLFTLGNQFDVKPCEPPEIDHADEPLVHSAQNTFDYVERQNGNERQLQHVQVGLWGNHQIRNAGVALATIRRLQEAGWKIPEIAIRTGLANVKCSGRIEVVQRNPTVIIDTAHNVASIQSLIETLNTNFRAASRILIFSASRDKDIAGMLRHVLPQFDEIVFTKFVTNPRAVPVEELIATAERLAAENAIKESAKLTAAATPIEALRIAQQHAAANDLICITGSFFLAAELRPELVLP
jgi:dihydrofolate synthase/folylpolyglutamate synthase